MFKGIGKQVVVLKNPDSEIFEEAIFILREKSEHNKKDLLTECERIINKNSNSLKTGKKAKNKKHVILTAGAFILTVIASVIITTIIL